jgi:D-alanyl-D-alanine carboxypeptidase/D-alanyl-D-alanine-endopeptidase (penicillin-binding protein 4)
MVKLRLFSHRDVVKACSKTVRESVSRAKRGVRIAAIGFICVAASGLNIAVAALPIVVTDALTKAGLPADSIGLVVERVSDQRVLYSNQAERSFHTASTMKLLTTAVALERLGPIYRGRTELRTDGTVNGNVLQGDLVLRGLADADFNIASFRGLLQSLRQQGIVEIKGDLVLDRSFFSPARLDIGVPPFDESPEFQYNVIPDALLLDNNLIGLTMASSADGLVVRMNPALDRVAVTSAMTLDDGVCKDWEDTWKTPVVERHADGVINVVLQGSYPKNCDATTRLNVIDRTDFIDRVFRSQWRELGGRFSGVTREGAVPADTRVLAEHRSRALPEIVRDINKPSDNALTRSLYLTMGSLATDGDKAATSAARGENVVRGWLRERGIPDAGLVLDNGSGLSRSERLPPRLLADVLRVMSRSEWAPEYLSSLPIVGIDGTMRNRLKDSTAAGRARVKTGTLRDVVSVAGYVRNADGEPYILVALINHPQANHKIARPVVDALIEWLSKQPSPAPLLWWQRVFGTG